MAVGSIRRALKVVITVGGSTWALTEVDPVSAATMTFDDVRVSGNERNSEDDVLELCGVAGQIEFDDASLQALVACLGQSGQFKNVALATEGRDLIVEVEEAPQYTGLLDVSVSADTDRGVSAKLLVEDTDLFDQGVLGRFEIEGAREEIKAQAMLVYPGVWGRGSIGGVVLSYQLTDYDGQNFSYRKATVAPFLSLPISENQSFTLRAGVEFDDMYDVALSASPILQREAGERTSPFLSFEYNAVYLPEMMPNSRIELQAGQAFVGLGQEHLFSKTQLAINATTAVVPDRLNLSVGLRAGHIEELGSEGSRSVDRFQLGGTSLRGFAPRGIGPKDGNEVLGGNSFAALQVETNSPLGSISSVDFEGGAFIDMGFVSGLSGTAGFTDPIDDSIAFRTSAGLALTAKIGEIPLSFYYAEPIEASDGDALKRFGFSVSNRF